MQTVIMNVPLRPNPALFTLGIRHDTRANAFALSLLRLASFQNNLLVSNHVSELTAVTLGNPCRVRDRLMFPPWHY